MKGTWKKYQCTKCRRKFIVHDEAGERVPRVDNPICPYGCVKAHGGEIVYATFDGDVTISTIQHIVMEKLVRSDLS